ncbi:DUF3138 family protein [Aquitalea aquatica]|uniref:DUF3138 family protein n=1 Tax=Aquitalea aquatica TaxID=3044273 RepID=A0A838YGE9_9NEIS|nr:DUF3138 family protein [Aquitalea magnusonii]MBA4710125.1 DUF3138 family protein [Aquitalea magnusonii]
MRTITTCWLGASLLSSLPLLAQADELDTLKASIASMQQQLQQLQQQLQQPPAPRPAAVADDMASETRQQLNNMEMKLDKLSDAADNGPLANLSISGYLDPLYVFNRQQHRSGFSFVNHDAHYAYDTANLGDVYLDIKKGFGSGPMAPYAEITIQPNRGSGVTTSWNASSANDSIINSAQLVIPLDQHWQVFAGQIPSFAGYEYATSPQTLTISHNLLYDFSEPAFFVGGGAQWVSGQWLWKGMLGNEAGRTETAQVGQRRNSTPSFSWRMDYQYTNNIDIGWSGLIGRGTAADYSGTATAFQPVFYTELDISSSNLNDTINAQLDYGSAGGSALNGGRAQWWGLSLLRHHRFDSAWLGKMGWTLRYDYLDNSKNGGGTPNLALGSSGNDGANGFGSDPACVAANGVAGCSGAKRQDITAALLFYPSEQLQLKLEYRHDIASQATFDNNSGGTGKHNDVLSAQAVYSF